MCNKRGLGRIPNKENSFNQDQINLAPLLAEQVSLIVQVNYIDLLKSWFHWKKQQHYIGYEIINPDSVRHLPPPPPPYYSPTKKVFGFARISWVVPGGVGGARAPPRPPVATPLLIRMVLSHSAGTQQHLDFKFSNETQYFSQRRRWDECTVHVTYIEVM